MSLLRKTALKRTGFARPDISTLKSSGLVQKASTFKAKPKPMKKKSASNVGWADVAKAIWDEPNNEHLCCVCGRYLGDVFSPAFYHHLVHRGVSRKLKREPMNLAQLCFGDNGCHEKAHDFGIHNLAEQEDPPGPWTRLSDIIKSLNLNTRTKS